MNYAKIGLFVGGLLFGTAGISSLTGKKAKKVYTQCTAAVLRGKDNVMKTAANIKENCGDIYADAIDINNKKYEEAEAETVERARAIVEEYDNKEAEAEQAEQTEAAEEE